MLKICKFCNKKYETIWNKCDDCRDGKIIYHDGKICDSCEEQRIHRLEKGFKYCCNKCYGNKQEDKL